jgi:hypothetical protein
MCRAVVIIRTARHAIKGQLRDENEVLDIVMNEGKQVAGKIL